MIILEPAKIEEFAEPGVKFSFPEDRGHFYLNLEEVKAFGELLISLHKGMTNNVGFSHIEVRTK